MGGVSGFDGLDHAGSNCAPPDTKKDRSHRNDLRAGECLVSVASDCESLDHRGVSQARLALFHKGTLLRIRLMTKVIKEQ
jgi:hypothetical protein